LAHFESFHLSGLRLSIGTFYFGQLGTFHFGATRATSRSVPLANFDMMRAEP
jgi:hypothetical protein